MLTKEKCLEKCQEYLRESHPRVWERLLAKDEGVRFKFYNVLVEYLQESGSNLSDNNDFDLNGAFGTNDAELEQLIEQVS